mmetsp:Transcript_8268/g.27838  ORF Transcript_8268/g.27838 Transcript_8268/m.27838 type:complete len:220 (-) Transcript_8268:547-1206(-)
MKGNSRTVYVTLSLFFSLASALPWAPGQPVARWQMKWKEEEGQDQRISEAHRKFLTEQVPTMKIIFRDQNFLVINKPYDVRMDGEHEVTVEKLAAQILLEDKANDREGGQGEEAAKTIRFPHRLDFATSGVLCIGLSRRATGAAGKLFESRSACKEYLAICYGRVAREGMKIDKPIANRLVKEGEDFVNPTGSDGTKVKESTTTSSFLPLPCHPFSSPS